MSVTSITVVPEHPYPGMLEALASTAVQALPSPHTRRAYTREIERYLRSGCTLTREGVLQHLNTLRSAGARPSTLNQALAAIRMLANEAECRGLIPISRLTSIHLIKGAHVRGVRAGKWLSLEESQRLLDTVSRGTCGARNAAIVACLIGCGLRRSEVAALDWSQWQMREGRWCWVDIDGKGGRVRTVPCPRWAARYVNVWKGESEKKCLTT